MYIYSPWGHQEPDTTERFSLTEATHPKACAPQQEKPPQKEAHAQQLESSPFLPQLDKACVKH